VAEFDVRALIARIAIEEEGKSDVAPYWLDVLVPPQSHPKDAMGRPLSWCGAFALWCLHQAGAAVGVHWITGRGFLRCAHGHGLPVVRVPRVGDVSYRNASQHHAVVVELGPPGPDGSPEWVSTVDGNSGTTAGGRVKLHLRTPIDHWDAFYDVEPLLPRLPESA
jgi:hypothetical protein